MTEDEDRAEFPYASVKRLVSAMAEVCLRLDQASPLHSHVRQMLDLLSVWDALPNEESRERALAAIQAVSARYRH